MTCRIRSNTLLVVAALCGCAAATSAQPTASLWRLVEDLRLDAVREGFTELTSARVGPRGQVVVTMQEDYRVRIYDSSASHFNTVGGVGSRPGEFTALGSLGWIADTLWISDGPLSRITFFSPEGKLLRLRPLPERPITSVLGAGGGVIRSLAPTAVYADGSVLARATMTPASATTPGANAQEAIVELSRAETVRVVAMIPGDAANLVRVATGRGQYGTSVPFTVRPLIAFAPDGARFAVLTADFASADSHTFTLRVMGPGGVPILECTYPFVGTPIPARLVDSAVGRARAAVSARGGTSAAAAEMESQLRKLIPPAYAPVTSMFLGVDGTTWLGVRPPTGGSFMHVLDERGAAIGTIRVPARSQVIQGSRTHVWVTERNAGQPISVVRYRVERT